MLRLPFRSPATAACFALAPVAGVVTACGGEAPTAVETNVVDDSIVGGTIDDLSTGIVGLAFDISRFRPDLDIAAGHCSGTLIAPNLVMTARHCTGQTAGGGPQGEVICGETGIGLQAPGDFILVSPLTPRPRTASDPTFFRGQEIRPVPGDNDLCGFDVVLILLETNIPGDLATPIIPRIDSTPADGDPFSAVGFGLTGPEGDPTTTQGIRYRTDGNQVFCSGAGCMAGLQVRDTEWVGESRTCPGDSGGPAIDETGRVIGVLSRGAGTQCELIGSPAFSVYGNTDAWGDFIVETALEAAERGGYDPPFWALTGESIPPDELGDPCEGHCIGPGFYCHDEDGDGQGTCVPRCDFVDNPECPIEHRCSGDVGACLPVPLPIGEACDGHCARGLSCFAETGQPPGICVTSCSAADPTCTDGYVCNPDVAGGLCLPESATEPVDDSKSGGGCTVSTTSPTGAPWWAAMVLGLAAIVRRRRRRA